MPDGFRAILTFAERLQDFPIALELVPPRRRASEKILAGFVERAHRAMQAVPSLDAINLPEILDENHVGQPFYRNLDPRKAATMLGQGGTAPEIIVNKVVVHFWGKGDLKDWLREALGPEKLRNFVLVGGTNNSFHYPGPSVVDANEVLHSIATDRPDVTCGNITIPERPGEVERLVAKTRAGCNFFTSQVLFEPEPMASVLVEYAEACAAESLKPATTLLSFAPVNDYEDVEFLVWLGASVSRETEEALLDRPHGDPGQASLDVARSSWARIRERLMDAGHEISLGVNVEEISAHNAGLALRMAKEFTALRDAER